MVENQTDNDWTDTQLLLVSGRPISFVQELYAPLYLSRPVVKPELYAGLRPQTYESGWSLPPAHKWNNRPRSAAARDESAGWRGTRQNASGIKGGGSVGVHEPRPTPRPDGQRHRSCLSWASRGAIPVLGGACLAASAAFGDAADHRR